jgi:hypothetical protein
MARPESHKDISDENKFTRVALFEIDKIVTNANLLKHYTALLEAIHKMGGRSEKGYNSVDLDIPKNQQQLDEQLKNDQYHWDDYEKLYRKALAGDSVDPIPEYRRGTLKEWAEKEGLPDPFDPFAANNEDIQKLRREMGLDND